MAGYHTEYSGMRFAMYYIAEYVNVITVSAIAATLFFGGWTVPFLPGRPVVAVAQDGVLRVCVRLAARDAAAPALRPADAAVAGAVLLPLGLLNVAITAIVVAAIG